MNNNKFFAKTKREWGSPHEVERHLRIKVAVSAYAYEIKDDPIMDDSEFDGLCRKVKLNKKTGNKKMDEWFINNFQPYTGQWVHNHPNRKGLNRIYKFLKGRRR